MSKINTSTKAKTNGKWFEKSPEDMILSQLNTLS